jgi:DNA-binding CsgD family transcriptional regulator
MMVGVRSAPGELMLRGRRDECAALDALLTGVRAGRSGVLVLRGEAGIGKTALLRYLTESASDLTVARAVGVESEMELPFAGLQQLSGPMLDRLPRLPAPQREALEIVFALSAGPAPDRFLVGLGVLSLFSEVAEDGPLLCVVDDAQWLDQASALTLAFVARRLLAEPVGIVFAAREPGEELQQLPELPLRGLRDGDARALLESAVRFILDEPVRDRIIAETRGNPLALLELPRGFNATQLAGGFGLPAALSLQGKIEESFVRRVRTMSDDARRLLLLAAAEPVGDPLLLWRAAKLLGVGPAAGEDVQRHGLLTIRERVTFRHPLVRSAVYGSATIEERRSAHRALAEATDREVDPDRRTWHMAAAAPAPDEQIASELERSAGRAQARGGLAAAAAFLQRAVALTVDPEKRTERALTAARASLDAGEFEAARRLLSTAEAGTREELQLAQVELLRGGIAFASSMGSAAPPLLLEAAERLAPLDANLAREVYLDAWGAALFAGRLAAGGDLFDVSRAARSAPPPTGPPRPSDLLLDGLAALITEGPVASAAALRQATSAFLEGASATQPNFRWGWLATIPSNVLWDEHSMHAINSRQLEEARDTGALARLPIDLAAWAFLVAWRGDFGAASAAIAEAEAATRATGSRLAPYAAVLLGALRGREADALPLIESMIRDAGAGGQGIGVQWARWVSSILFNGQGSYDQALTAAERAAEEMPQLFLSAWARAELIEAAVRSGKPERATAALELLVAVTSTAGTDWAMGISARSRALMSEGETAEHHYREALDHLSRARLRPELARAHLLYGEWLRREERRVDARAQLRAAFEQCTAIGMEAFAERAGGELLATGERVRKRAAETRDDLTAQERHIAGLARDGLSNQEIGARLFLSQHTVAYHLRKVFSKLEITSRNQLTQVLPG